MSSSQTAVASSQREMIDVSHVLIRRMEPGDAPALAEAFAHMNKRRELYDRYWRENVDYAIAQRLYPKLDYVHDGTGIHEDEWGGCVYSTKQLGS